MTLSFLSQPDDKGRARIETEASGVAAERAGHETDVCVEGADAILEIGGEEYYCFKRATLQTYFHNCIMCDHIPEM